MASLHEHLSQQFYNWELRGRGWNVSNDPVYPEPPFVPFHGYYAPPPVVDDGRRPTILSSLCRKISGQSEPVTQTALEPEEEPESIPLVRDNIVELQTSLPADLDTSNGAVERFLRNLSLCREPVSFEILGTAGRVNMIFAAAEKDAPLVRRQLQSYFPEAVFQPGESLLENAWVTCSGENELVVEFGLAKEFMFQLATGDKLDPFIGIIGALSELDESELGLFQVLFQATHEPWAESIIRSVTDAEGKPFFVNQPELTNAAESKIALPLYAAVVRIAIKAETFERTMEIACDIAASLRVFSNLEGNELIPLANDDYPVDDHVEDVLRRQSRRHGMLLNSEELIGFVHLPSSAVRSAALTRDSGKTKAAPKIAVNSHGLLLGINQYAGVTSEVRLTAEQRVRHTYIIGASGTGKSTLLFNLIMNDIENGQGLAVLDPHGDLIEKILGCIPPERIDDVVLVDPSDEEFSVGFNILSAHSDLEKNILASDLVSVFQRLSTSWGDQMNSVLGNAIRAFLESSQGGTLADLRRFLIEPKFRDEFLKSVNDPDIVYYWKKGFPLLSGNKSVGPVLTRLETFLSPKPIRYMVSQKQNRLDFADIMNSGKIFLAKLSQGKMGKENSYLLGSLLVAKFHQTAMSRQNMKESDRRNFWLYMDEFQNFITPSMAEILTGARKYRVGLILAHQELRQLQRDSEVASAVLSNPYTRVCFRVGDQDAKTLENGFSFFEAKDLQNLGTGEAICRVERSAFDFNLSVPLLPEADEATAAETRERTITSSRKKYALSRSEIEAALRQQTEAEPIAPVYERPRNVEAKPAEKIQSVADVPKPAEPISAVPKPESTPVAKIEIADEAPPKLPPDKGIGGHQHNLIRERIELIACQLGYSTSRENPTGDGGKIDVVLEKPQRTIACEIAITTTIDHEVGNVAKCLKAGFKHIAVISPGTDRLEKIQNAVRASISPEDAMRVGFFLPDQFIAHLQEFTIQDTTQASAENPSAKTIGKYKVKSGTVKLTPEEMKEREASALGMLAKTMQRKK